MLKVFRSNQVERLLTPLARSLDTPLSNPLAPEVISVASRGMSRWLGLQLAQHHGIAANLEHPFPGRLVQQAFTQVLEMPEGSLECWDPPRLVWTILAGLGELLEREEFAPLRGYVQDDPKGLKRFQLASRIARVFERYASYRPELLLRWARADDSFDTWQPLLFQWLRARLDTPTLPELMRQFTDRVTHRGGHFPALPERVSVFGVTTLPPMYTQVLALLAGHVDLSLYLLSPSDQWWADIRSKREIQRSLFAQPQLAEEALAMEEGHPLLASLGKLGRDFQAIVEKHPYVEPRPDLFVDPGSDTLLHALQSDMLALERRGRDRPAIVLADADQSVQLHACHSPMRQVQLLQDHLLHLFNTLPALKPRDVVVLLPDVESWAPLIHAVFDRAQEDDRFIPFKVADRSMRKGNGVASATLAILELVGGRAQASAVLDLLSHPEIRQRQGLVSQDLEQLTEWVAASGIRWGWDAAHRQRMGQPADPQNTWAFGLERLLLGVAMPGDGRRMWQGVLPYDEIEGQTTHQLGRFVDFVQKLRVQLAALEHPRSLERWAADIGAMMAALLHRDDDNAWQHLQLLEALQEAVEHSAEHSEPVDLRVLRLHLESLFGESRPSASFLGGRVLFCGMEPMRTIPFRVVCMLGMDERAFPRHGQQLGFDHLVTEPKLGDRSPREDDRYLFLESTLSARDRLWISYTGLGVRDNKPLPPSVVVSELLDSVLETCTLPPDPALDDDEQERRLRERLVHEHPLQPFSPRNFQPPRFSYARDHLRGAQSLLGSRQAPPPFFDQPLPEQPPLERLSIQELAHFFQGPIPFLLRKGLGLRLQDQAIEIADREPIELDGLALYAIAEPLLGRSLEGETLDQAYPTVRAQGLLPLGSPGDTLYSELHGLVGPLAERVRGYLDGGPLPAINVDQALGGVRLHGRLERMYPAGRVLHQYSRIRSKHMVALWVEHLCMQLVDPQPSYIIGRPERGGGVMTLRFRKVDEPEPLLEELLRLYELGRRYPLLFFPETSLSYVRARQKNPNKPPWYTTKSAFLPYNPFGSGGIGEGHDPYVQKVLGDVLPWEVKDQVALPNDWDFERLANRIGLPLRNHMEGRR